MVRVLLTLVLAGIYSVCDAVYVGQFPADTNSAPPISLFTEVSESFSRGATYVTKHKVLALQQMAVKELLNKPKELLQMTIPHEDRLLLLDLVQVSPFANDFSVRTSSGQTYEAPRSISYRGGLDSDPESLVAVTISEEEVFGVISSEEIGNVVFGPWGSNGQHIVYEEEDLQVENSFSCASILPPGVSYQQIVHNTSRSADPEECVRIYLETSYSLFVKKQKDVDLLLTYVAGFFNQVATLFAAEGIKVEISELYIWTTEDPYDHGSSDAALEDFRLARPDFNGNLGHFLDFSGNNNGGRAYVDVLCSSSHNVGYSDISSVFQAFPTYSWTVNVVAHELGHGMGSHHTQDCVWGPTQCSAIDGCAEPNPNLGCGTCDPGPIPAKGTIMSYCHLEKGNGINFRLGFGQEPGDLIRSKVASSNCLQICSGNVLGCHLITDSIQVVPATCGRDNGSMLVHLSGASGAIHYDIGQGPQIDPGFEDLTPGQYLIEVSDDADCSTKEVVIVPRASEEPSIVATVTNSSCGGGDGVLELSTTSAEAVWYQVGGIRQSDSLFEGLAAGDYQVTLMDEQGCSAEKKVHIFEESSPQASVSISASSCGLENGAVEILPFGGTAPYLLAFANQTTRDFSAMETSGVIPQRISGLSAGFYELELMDARGCVDSIQISIDSSQAPRLSYDLIPAQCETATGAIAVLADHGNGPYKAWLNGDPVDMGVMVTNLEVGTYSIMVRDSMDCQDTVFVDLKYDDRFSPPELPMDQILCEGGELLLNTGLLDQQIEWTHDGERLLSREPAIEVRAPGVYEATVIYDQNCAIRSSTMVMEKAIPTTRLERHQSICAGDSLVIPDIDPRYEYSWSNGDVGPQAYFPYSGTHHVEIQDSGYCPQIIPFEILVVEPVNLVGHPQEIWACEGQEVQLLVSGAEEYLWTSADPTLVDLDIADPIVAPRVNGEYLVEGKNQCFSDTMIFSIRIHPVLGRKQDAELFSGSTLKLPDPSENVIWTATGGHRCESCTTDEFVMQESGMVFGSYLDANGCSQTDTVIVSVYPLEDILPQLVNVVTPNNDGINDMLKFSGSEEFDNVTLEVFDQAGNQLYKSNDYKNDWAATYNGALLQEGVYFYLLTLVYKGRVFQLDSDLTIVRN